MKTDVERCPSDRDGVMSHLMCCDLAGAKGREEGRKVGVTEWRGSVYIPG